jgi:23S rRNA U2552 (ribose-2'-O)-methylase RlmE/FtsJ
MEVTTTKVFPPETYAVMVGKLHADRVVQYLMRTDQVVVDGPETAAFDATDNKAGTVELLDSPALTGVSRARRGYNLLLLQRTKRSIANMSAMGRRNVSWISRITHHSTYNNTSDDEEKQETTSNVTHSAALSSQIWESILHEGFDVRRSLLRIDTYPKSAIEWISRRLQEAAAAHASRKGETAIQSSNDIPFTIDLSNPFECGPILMTPSRSKCTHRLTVIQLSTSSKVDNNISSRPNKSESKNTFRYYWGLENRQDHSDVMTVPLNNEASQELVMLPCLPKTGEDRPWKKLAVDLQTPLSRAYYKLQEVWTEYLQPQSGLLSAKRASGVVGLDIGASPGGWTQVMVHSMGLARVVALDPAQLATRVSQLPQVTHVASKLDEAADWKQHGPFGLAVCDACVIWHDLLEYILVNLKREQAQWELPCVWVLTMKLPFKTLESIKRQVGQIRERLPKFAEDLTACLYPTQQQVHCEQRIVHLMANSDSERTLILTFQKRKE